MLHRLNTSQKKAVAIAIICLLLALLLSQAQGLQAPWLDTQADDYFETTITQAGVAYGTVRLINASVSVIMESKLQVQPAGVGLSLAVGQVLDPLNDMAERLSDVLVAAIVSLGVQKLIYEISVSLVPMLLAMLLLPLALLLCIHQPWARRLQSLLFRGLLILCVLRLFLPLSSMINGLLYQQFFAAPILEAKQAIDYESQSIQSLADFSRPSRPVQSNVSQGFWQQWLDTNAIAQSSDFLVQKSDQIKQAFLSKQKYASEIIDHLLRLTYLYVGLFVLQIILLPLALFYMLLRLGQLLQLPYSD